jgi:hypothetical protein
MEMWGRLDRTIAMRRPENCRVVLAHFCRTGYAGSASGYAGSVGASRAPP